MSERTSYAPGTPSWVDMGSPDPAAAAAFYGALFGWTVDFDSYSPAASLEWRGHRTVNALVLLRADGRL